MTSWQQQSRFKSYISYGIHNICSFICNGCDTCPMLLEIDFYGEDQIACDLVGFGELWFYNKLYLNLTITNHKMKNNTYGVRSFKMMKDVFSLQGWRTLDVVWQC